MDTECAPGDSDKRLILPGGVENGVMTTREYNILKLKKDELKELCRAYGLNCSGNKAPLQGRLRAFSANKDDWARINPEPRRMHRGPQTGKIAKAKHLKPSVRRANEVFNPESSTHVPHLPYRLPDQELPASETQGHALTLYDWASAISSAYPYVSKEDRLKAGQARLRKQALSQHYVISGELPSTSNSADPTQPQPCRFHEAQVVNMPHTSLPFSAPSHLTPTCVVTPAPAPLLPPSSHSHKSPATRTLKLGNGTRLEFTADEAGPPPAISFADDLPRLNRMWDDRDWNNDSALVIKGIPIPIVHWRAVYGRSNSENLSSGKLWRRGDWKKIKGSWSEWKLIVTRWRQSSEDDFWKEFSDNHGSRLNYKAIVSRLTEIRKTEDKRLVDEARNHYGTEFANIFWYKKSGIRHVKTKDRDIAKQYRQELAKLDSVHQPDDMDLESD